MLHYTWGSEFHEESSKGKKVWQFDKRLFSGGLPHHLLPLPPRVGTERKLYLQVRNYKPVSN